MITTRPAVAIDGLYSQSQAASVLGVDRHTVKRYEDNGLILFKVRKASRRKVTTGKQILRCWEATYL